MIPSNARLIPRAADATNQLRHDWARQPKSSIDKWKDIVQIVGAYNKDKDARPAAATAFRKWERALEDIILQYTYPRIDAEVSKRRNHLLKSPFVIHPGTGRSGRAGTEGAAS